MLRGQTNRNVESSTTSRGRDISFARRVTWLLAAFSLLACCAPVVSFAQTKKQVTMLIEGTIRLDPESLPPGVVIRILRRDSSIAKSAFPYGSLPNKFGVRLATVDGFQPGDPILFRVVLSQNDSFICHYLDAPLYFTSSGSTEKKEVFSAFLGRNHKPLIVRSIPDTVIREGRIFVYKVFARDIDLDRLTYKLTEGPPGAQMGAVAGIFLWTPSYEDSGSHRVVIQIDDGYDRVMMPASNVYVRNVNRPPVIVQSPAGGTVREGESMLLEVQGFDPDHDSLSYRFAERTGKFNAQSSSGQWIFLPSFTDSGFYEFTATASDGFLSDSSSSFIVHVENVNRAPIITSSSHDTVIDENQEIRIQFSTSDPDGDSTHTTLLSAPLGAEFSQDGTFYWKPNGQQAGEYILSVGASDYSLTQELNIHVSVRNVNHAPSAVSLLSPLQQDTLDLEQSGRYIEFSWTSSLDEDIDDLLRYDLHIVGSAVDTAFKGILDTSVVIGFRNKLQAGRNYTWFVVANDGHDQSASAEVRTFRIALSLPSAREHQAPLLPKQYLLQQTIPDPSSAVASIRYALPERSRVQLSLYNMVGERLRQLVAEEKDPGIYEYGFDTSNLTNGVYLVELQAHPLAGIRTKDFISTKKMVLVR